jgi:formamidopyrimidine-DNA glycosylase
MPEYPEVVLYLHALEARILDQRLERLRIASPSLLRSVEPPPSELAGRRLIGLERIGKRIVLAFESELFAVIHLMIAGRLQWRPHGAPIPRRLGHAAFDFESGTLLLTEAGTKKRAQLHIVRGRDALAQFDRGGIDPLQATLPEFATALRRENRTLKRALTDPRILSGIGNAHSDEILHEAQLSPARLTSRLDDAEIQRLYEVTRSSLSRWADLLIEEAGADFPVKVTAFHPRMAVHGRYGQPCPRCGTPIQRIKYADNETNYCPTCQTGGKLLADRAFSRLLREDWPRTLDELEQHFQDRR